MILMSNNMYRLVWYSSVFVTVFLFIFLMAAENLSGIAPLSTVFLATPSVADWVIGLRAKHQLKRLDRRLREWEREFA